MAKIHTISPKLVLAKMDKAIAYRVVPNEDNSVELYLVYDHDILESVTVSVWAGVCAKMYLAFRGCRELSYGELSNIAIRNNSPERWWV